MGAHILPKSPVTLPNRLVSEYNARWWAITGFVIGLLLIAFIIFGIVLTFEGTIPTLPGAKKIVTTDD